MQWFDSMMWGWLRFYADALTVVGLIGLAACIWHAVWSFSVWADRKVSEYENKL